MDTCSHHCVGETGRLLGAHGHQLSSRLSDRIRWRVKRKKKDKGEVPEKDLLEWGGASHFFLRV